MGEGERRPAPMRVLFLCTGNSARSQIAEALLAECGGGRFVTGSAGTHPAARVHPDAIALLAARGIDWSARTPKSIDDVARERWDMVITVCDNARESCPVLPGMPRSLHWGVADPAAVDDANARRLAFAATAATLEERIRALCAMSDAELAGK